MAERGTYDFFVSYGRRADTKLAGALRRGLARLGRPGSWSLGIPAARCIMHG
ncbi:MAG TPA: hypothetical protein VEP49_19310 [Acidimicrobiia bacterium]|nr:hypothetical protein [Acidimicrobiia bacterium]